MHKLSCLLHLFILNITLKLRVMVLQVNERSFTCLVYQILNHMFESKSLMTGLIGSKVWACQDSQHPPDNWLYSYLIGWNALSLINACYAGPHIQATVYVATLILDWRCRLLLIGCLMSWTTGIVESKIRRLVVGNVTLLCCFV